MTNETLLPCPFCGGTNLRAMLRHYQHEIDCVDCNISGPSASKKELAAEKWNTRQAVARPSMVERLSE